jgi:hypothetical protein
MKKYIRTFKYLYPVLKLLLSILNSKTIELLEGDWIGVETYTDEKARKLPKIEKSMVKSDAFNTKAYTIFMDHNTLLSQAQLNLVREIIHNRMISIRYQ